MPTITKTWDFAAGVAGFTDLGFTYAGLPNSHFPFAAEASDGSPSPGCAKWTATGSLSGPFGDGVRADGTWEDWGVPAGASVQSVQLTGWQYRVAAHGGMSSWALGFAVADGLGSVAPAMASLTDSAFPGAWGAGPTGGPVSVALHARASDSAVWLALTLATEMSPPVADVDIRIDTIALAITYGGGADMTPAPRRSVCG